MRKLMSVASAAILIATMAGCLQPIPNKDGEASSSAGSAARKVEGVKEGAYPAATFFDARASLVGLFPLLP